MLRQSYHTSHRLSAGRTIAAVGLAAKCRLKLRKIRQRSIHPVFPCGVRIGLHHDPLFFDPDCVSAPLSPRDEKLLFGSKAIDVRGRGLPFIDFWNA